MKENKGVTMVVLVITIVLLLILAGISIGTGSKVIKSSELENLKTNMLLIKVKAKEYVENANFQLGTNFESATDKETRIANAKAELKVKGEEIDKSILEGKVQTTEDKEYTYYYKLSTEDLNSMGISKVDSDENNGYFVIKYDLQDVEVEIYNTKGFENEGTTYYSLSDIQNLNV